MAPGAENLDFLVVLFADNSANVLNGLLHYNANGVYKVSVAYAFGAYAHVVKLVRNSSVAFSLFQLVGGGNGLFGNMCFSCKNDRLGKF